MSRRAMRRLIVVVTTTAVLMALLPTPARAAQADLLILASLASGGSNSFEVAAAKQLNLSYDLVDDATWSAKQTADFAKYKAIVLGDPTCGNLSQAAAAQGNAATWGAAVTGNVVLSGTDPTFHGVYGPNQAGAKKLILNALQFAASGSGTGASVSLSCYYAHVVSATPVPLLDGFAPDGFKVVGEGSVCPNASHVVDGVLGLTDADLVDWHCSTHEAFTTWPGNFSVVAIQQDIPSTYIAVDNTHGAPYILVRAGSTRFDPQRNGYNFNNVGDVTKNGQPYQIPYDRMKDYYPNSRGFMYDSLFRLAPVHSIIGQKFYDEVFKPFYDAGLCFGMASSSVHYYNSGGKPDLYGLLPVGSLDAQSLNNAPLRDVLELWHSRQLGAKGAHDSITSWEQTPNASGNEAAFQRIASVVASRPMVVGIGPSKALYNSDAQRWIDLFMNVSHAVVAYGFDSAHPNQLIVYDPNYHGGQSARLELQSGGGLKLIHVDPNRGELVDIGGGGANGDASDWVLVPLNDSAFEATGNDTWALTDLTDIWLILKNINLPKGFITGKPPRPMLPFHGIVPGAPTFAGTVPAGTDVSAEVTNLGDGSDTSLIAGSHVVSAEQTGTSAGTSHLVTLSADASAIALSGASTAETFDLLAGADIDSQYSRSVQLRGVSLDPGASIRYATDAEAAVYTFVSSGGAAQSVSATITQNDQTPLVVQLQLPADGTATLHVYDWSALSSSLVWEDVQTASGITVNILQDNPAQRGRQVQRDFDAMRLVLATTTPAGFATSLQAKIDEAAALLAGGAPGDAANVLGALQHEIAAQIGTHLTQAQADAAALLIADAIGLLQAP